MTTCRQMGRINVDSLHPSQSVCVCVCGGDMGRGGLLVNGYLYGGVSALSGAGEPFSIFCVIKL